MWRVACLLPQALRAQGRCACSSQGLQTASALGQVLDGSSQAWREASSSHQAGSLSTRWAAGPTPSVTQPCSPHHRAYSSAPEPDVSSIGNEKVQKIAADILNLSVLESSWLSEILRKKLNLQKPAFGAMPAFPMAAAGAPAAAAGPAAGAPAAAAKEEKKPEKTTFDIKLESFSADGKIKVIKEIRTITSLGLKEAKELVEKAPVVIKADVAKEAAEEMKKLIEAAGGKVALL